MLSEVNLPEDIKRLSFEQLTGLCSEIRKFIVDAVNKNPEKFDELLRELYIKVLWYFNHKKI